MKQAIKKKYRKLSFIKPCLEGLEAEPNDISAVILTSDSICLAAFTMSTLPTSNVTLHTLKIRLLGQDFYGIFLSYVSLLMVFYFCTTIS